MPRLAEADKHARKVDREIEVSRGHAFVLGDVAPRRKPSSWLPKRKTPHVKQCLHCGVEFDYRERGFRYARAKTCSVTCSEKWKREANRRYAQRERDADPDGTRLYAAIIYEKTKGPNPERSAKRRAARAADPEAYRERERAYYAANREARRARGRACYARRRAAVSQKKIS